MSPETLARLEAAKDAADAMLKQGADATDVIAALVVDHRASFRAGADTNRLRVAGVAATCTWSKGAGLLEAWRRLATLRIVGARQGGFGSER